MPAPILGAMEENLINFPGVNDFKTEYVAISNGTRSFTNQLTADYKDTRLKTGIVTMNIGESRDK